MPKFKDECLIYLVYLLSAITLNEVVNTQSLDKVLPHCKPEFVRWTDRSCVKFVEQKKTLSEARSFCHKLGTDLIRVDSEEKNTWLSALVPSNKDEYLIGLFSSRQGWKWLNDSKPAIYKRLEKQYSDLKIDKNFGIATISKSSLPMWIYSFGSLESKFICEQLPKGLPVSIVGDSVHLTLEPGEVGQPFPPMTCSVDQASTTDMQFKILLNISSRFTILFCSNNHCRVSGRPRNLDWKFIEETHYYGITITLNSTVKLDDNGKWSCTFSSNEHQNVKNSLLNTKTVNVSTFLRPSSPSCRSRWLAPNNFEVYCSVSNVYPRVSSVWFHAVGGQELELSYPKVNCETHNTNFFNCKVPITLQKFPQGKHYVKVFVYPEVNFIKDTSRHAASSYQHVEFDIKAPTEPPLLLFNRTFKMSKDGIQAKLGQSILFECRVEGGNPTIWRIFLRLENSVGDHKKVLGKRVKLLVLVTKEKDDHWIVCSGEHISNNYTKISRVRIGVAFAANITLFSVNGKEGKETEISMGGSLDIKCTASGNPKPKIRLYKLFHSSRHLEKDIKTPWQTKTEVAKTVLLKDDNCHLSGQYICSANNIAGALKAVSHIVKVKCTPRPCSKKIQQYFHEPGEEASVTFCVIAYPKPIDMWLERANGEPLDRKQYEVVYNRYDRQFGARVQTTIKINSAAAKIGKYSLMFVMKDSSKHVGTEFSLILPQSPVCPESLQWSPHPDFYQIALLSWVPQFDFGIGQTFIVYKVDKAGNLTSIGAVNGSGSNTINFRIWLKASQFPQKYTLNVKNGFGMTVCSNLTTEIAVFKDPSISDKYQVVPLEPCTEEEYSAKFSCPTEGFLDLETVPYCVLYVEKPAEWDDAKFLCKYRNSTLLVADTKDINIAVAANIPPPFNESYWIGLKNTSTKLVWLDEETNAQWFNWESARPDAKSRSESCISLLSNGLWREDDCRVEKRYVCQQPSDRSRHTPNMEHSNVYGGDQTFLGSPINILCATIADNESKMYYRITRVDDVIELDDDDQRISDAGDKRYYKNGRLCLSFPQKQLTINMTGNITEWDISCCLRDAAGISVCTANKPLKKPIYMSRPPVLKQSSLKLDRELQVTISCSAYVGTGGILYWKIQNSSAPITSFKMDDNKTYVMATTTSDWHLLKEQYQDIVINTTFETDDEFGPKVESTLRVWPGYLIKATIVCEASMPKFPETNTPDKTVTTEPFNLAQRSLSSLTIDDSLLGRETVIFLLLLFSLFAPFALFLMALVKYDEEKRQEKKSSEDALITNDTIMGQDETEYNVDPAEVDPAEIDLAEVDLEEVDPAYDVDGDVEQPEVDSDESGETEFEPVMLHETLTEPLPSRTDIG